MTELKCSVYSCTHHKGDMCCKPNIRVGGESATEACETACISYAPKGDTNNIGTTTPNERLEIACSATECAYNKNTRCAANNVSINTMGGGAGCSTFTKK